MIKITKFDVKIGRIFCGLNGRIYEVLNAHLTNGFIDNKTYESVLVAEFNMSNNEFKFIEIREVRWQDMRILPKSDKFKRLVEYNV